MDKEKLEQALRLNNKISNYEHRIATLEGLKDVDIKVYDPRGGKFRGELNYNQEDEREILNEIKARILEFFEKKKAEAEQEFKSM